jgi:hypothetical protein
LRECVVAIFPIESEHLIAQLHRLEVVVMDRHDDASPGQAGGSDPAANTGEDPDLDARPQRVGRRVRSVEAAAVAGGIYAVLAVVGLSLLSRYPSLDQTEDEITAWFDDSANQSSLIIGLNLVAVSSIAFLWFVAVIRRRLGDLEDRFFGTVFFGSAIVYVAIWLVGGAVLAGPALATARINSGSVSRASASLAGGIGASRLLVVAPRVQAVFVLTTSTLILRSRVLPSWLAIVGYVIAAGMFFFPLVMEPLGLGFPTWVFVVSLVIFLRRPTGRRNSATEPNGSNST